MKGSGGEVVRAQRAIFSLRSRSKAWATTSRHFVRLLCGLRTGSLPDPWTPPRSMRDFRHALRLLLHRVRRGNPVAGGSFAYLRVELGDFVAFIGAGNILLEYVIGAHSLPDDYGHLDPIAVVVVSIICVLAILSTKGSSRFNYIASIVHIVVILFIIIGGLINADTKNYSDFVPNGPRGIFKASAVLFFAYVGFDAVSTMAEETKNPARDIPIGLVGSMTITTLLYCLLAVTLCLMVPYQQIDPDAPFSVAFQVVGWDWAKYVVAAGALKGMTTVLLVSAVNAKTGTPVNATIVMLAATAIIAFFTNLSILSNLLSISTLFIFMLVALALLVRRYYVSGMTTSADRTKLIVCILVILGSSVATAAIWGAGGGGWIGYVITLPIWFFATLALNVFVPQARPPKLWGVPLVPWLPSASILVNIFLLGSIDRASFVRFGVWTVILLIYYFLFGLHASYDTAKESRENRAEDGWKGMEEGA
ncbi:hypothetical protein GH714_017284 [Hevea brasiliensis]|uniref:Cationic amino acid transporter C-terminal domain-containing protein n=1 Tax=Hevea brasiliensis TaxID=3981 RepID=A0A6A6MBZ7_HEVBR|nr:hypothetical protein GH714_017284 [Hevea brasiliensis]